MRHCLQVACPQLRYKYFIALVFGLFSFRSERRIKKATKSPISSRGVFAVKLGIFLLYSFLFMTPLFQSVFVKEHN
ncbi:MAG TPA: hypothetical protein DEP65_03695 [Ruminococcus sp.]|nr:hypothetical protein [Ruminococcus sp.]